MENIVFFETIAQPKGFWFLVPVFILLGISVLLVGIIFSMKNTSISIKDNEIIIKSFLYGRKIPIDEVLFDEIKTVNLNESKEYNVAVRTNGIYLPNFLSGWTRLKNGKKALAYLTNREKVLFMPTQNFIVLFSMEKTDEFVSKLNEKRNNQ